MSNEKSVTIQAGGEEFKILKSRLKHWIELDEIQESLFESISAAGIVGYLMAATPQTEEFWQKVGWIEAVEAYLTISALNAIRLEIPILTIRDQVGAKVIPWDYKGRGWYVWLNLFAKAYGWKADYIAEMEVEDAFALLQEIETEKQLEREWFWQTTEIAYPYNKDTKRSEFHALPRPAWMRGKVGPPKERRVPLGMRPVGNVIDLMKQYAESRSSV